MHIVVHPSHSEAGREELLRLIAHTTSFAAADRFWSRYLTPTQRKRLGNDFMKACKSHFGAMGFYKALHGTDDITAILETAKLLGFCDEPTATWILRDCGQPVTAEEKFAAAIKRGTLTILEDPREAYWESKRIETDWYKYNAMWNFLLILAENARCGKSVDSTCLGEFRERNAVNKLKSRLTNLPGFPITLSDAIKNAGRGSKRLDVTAESICIFATLED